MNLPVGYFYDCDRGAAYVRHHLDVALSSGNTAWFVLHNSFYAGRSPEMESALDHFGFVYTIEFFGALDGLTLYRAKVANPIITDSLPELSEEQCAQLIEVLNELGMALEADQQICGSLSALFNGDSIHVNSPAIQATLAMRIMEVDLNLAEGVARNAAQKAPEAAVTHFVLGSILTLQGRHEEASEAYRQCFAATPDYYPHFFEKYLNALIEQDFDVASVELEKLAEANAFVPERLQRYFRIERAPVLYQAPLDL